MSGDILNQDMHPRWHRDIRKVKKPYEKRDRLSSTRYFLVTGQNITVGQLLLVPIGVGFRAQKIIDNFISGWILKWERPIRIGDVIGAVQSIKTRSTRIRRADCVHVDGAFTVLSDRKTAPQTMMETGHG